MNATAQIIPMQQPQTNEFNEVGLASKALLASLTISMPSGTKKDKEASTETAASHQADTNAVSVNKRLWPKEAMQMFSKPANAARKAFAEQSLPWGKGSRILAAAGYARFQQTMQTHEAAFWVGVDSFIKHVEEHINTARQQAGTLYDEGDYTLDKRELRSKFNFDLQYLPVPTQGDFRVNLSAVEQDRIKEQLSKGSQQAYTTAVTASWQRLYDTVSTMSRRLKAFDDGETKIIRSAIVDNVAELCDILPTLNLSGDPELAKMAKEAKELLTGSDTKDLKADTGLRKDTRMAADAVAKKVSAYMGLL